MKKNKIHFIVLILFHIIILFFTLFLNQNIEDSMQVINSYFHSVFFFVSYLFFSNIYLYHTLQKEKNKKIWLKKIIEFHGIFTFALFVIIILLLLILQSTENIHQVFDILIQLLIISFWQTIFILNFNNKIDESEFLKRLLIISIFYVIIERYGNNILVINLYRYYFMGLYQINAVYHYFFWGVIIYVIGYLKKGGDNSDRIKRGKKRI